MRPQKAFDIRQDAACNVSILICARNLRLSSRALSLRVRNMNVPSSHSKRLVESAATGSARKPGTNYAFSLSLSSPYECSIRQIATVSQATICGSWGRVPRFHIQQRLEVGQLLRQQVVYASDKDDTRVSERIKTWMIRCA